MREVCLATIAALGLMALSGAGYADELTIYQVQYTEDPNGVSPHDGELIDCTGGICVGKYGGRRPRVFLQDPANLDGWGGIQVKDFTAGELFDNVELGDWVALTNVLVEEFRGTTFLQYQSENDAGYVVVSQGNPLPPPLSVAVSEIPAPECDPNTGDCYVENHEAELYESMRLRVWDVTVTELDLGKAVDNYNLQNDQGEDCWATDYMNADKPPELKYHPLVFVGQHFCAVSGLFEQYTSIADGWDYYQLVTMSSADLSIVCPVDEVDGVRSSSETGTDDAQPAP